LNSEVEIFILDLNQPMLNIIQQLRMIIYKAEPALTEQIKWNAPSFCYKGDDRITFNFPPKKDCVLLVFHRGAAKKEVPSQRLITDDSGILEWKTNDRAVARFSNLIEVENQRNNLDQIIRLWLEYSQD